MRVLWLCNIMLPMVAEHLNREASNKEGWMTGLSERILQADEEKKLELGVCFPVPKELDGWKEKIGILNNHDMPKTLSVYGFYENLSGAEIYDKKLENKMRDIISDFKPDVVHIFGTEYPHTLAMTRAYHRPERTLIGIQGICTECARYYMADIPTKVQKRRTFRDIVKQDSIIQQQQKFFMRGMYESEAIKNVNHITGRTEWDKEYIYGLNPNATYHFMNETLRAGFYEGEWKYENCEKHSIFISQGDYPLKGLHYVLNAMENIVKKYPDAKLYVAGNSICETKTVKQKIKLSSYGKYIRDLIIKNGLKNHVFFVGKLTADEMKERYIKCHVFICASSVENSPNSVGEAMILGVPTIAAATGGIASIFHGSSVDDSAVCDDVEKDTLDDGILYEAGNIEELENAIMIVWNMADKVTKYTQNAKQHAFQTHSADANFIRLMEIYRDIEQSERSISFVSNYINHHQIPFCNELYKRYGDKFTFIQTEPMEAERVQMGWDENKMPSYVKKYYEEPEVCQKLIDEDEVVIWGGIESEEHIKTRLNCGKMTFRYSERLYKEGRWKAISPKGLIKKYHDHTKYRNENIYLLCAGAYVAGDFDIIRAYPKKKFKWGYFPECRKYDYLKLSENKNRNTSTNGKKLILWAARMIDWKHPEMVLQLAEELKRRQINAEIIMIGDGVLREKIEKETRERKISDVIQFTGAKTPKQVRTAMEKADIYLATSDYKEGWGAVLNEAMNSGCAVVACKSMGATNYLIEDGINGFSFKNMNTKEMVDIVSNLIDNDEIVERSGKCAYETILKLWNPENAANALNEFLDYGTVRNEGPCSRA